jgi:MFS family permease
MIGLGGYAAVSLLYIAAWNFASLISFRFLHGIGSAMAIPVAMAYAADLAPDGQEGKYMGTMNLAMFGGMGMGPLIGGTLSDMLSLSAPFYVMCAGTAVSVLLVMLYLPESVSKVKGGEQAKPSFRKILANRILLANFVFRTINSIGRGAIFGFLTMYISTSIGEGGLGLSVTIAGTIISFGQLSNAALQRPCGVLADRYDKNMLILLGGAISALGMAGFPLSRSFWHLMFARLVFSLGSAMMMPAMSAIEAIEGRKYGLGTTMSVMQSSMSLGNMAGPLLSGILADMFSLRPIFYMGTGISVLGLVLYVLLRPRNKVLRAQNWIE